MKKIAWVATCIAGLFAVGCTPSGGASAPTAGPKTAQEMQEQQKPSTPGQGQNVEGAAKPLVGAPLSPDGSMGKPGQAPPGIPR